LQRLRPPGQRALLHGSRDRCRQSVCGGRRTQMNRNRVKLVLAWGLVGIPLVWGVVETLVNAIKAFQ
jgi:hypothetical protein